MKDNPTTDPHSLYEAAVQNVSADADFVERVFRHERGRRALSLREDFCGTAALSAHWVTRRPQNISYGIDLHSPTLQWGKDHRLTPIGDKASRVTLVRADVRQPKRPLVDVQVAFNFSYFTFKTREELGGYFRAAYESLGNEGVFFLDTFGGCESLKELREETPHQSSRDPDGRRVPPFTYIWDQAAFNPIDAHLLCHIHFRLRGGRMIHRAFTYDWRYWSLPELTELLLAAGFERAEVYIEGFDKKDNEPNGIFRRRRFMTNESSFLAYVVGIK